MAANTAADRSPIVERPSGSPARRAFVAVKTAVLLSALAGAFVVADTLLGGRTGTVLGLALGLGLMGASRWFSDRIAIAAAQAPPAVSGRRPRAAHHGRRPGRTSRCPQAPPVPVARSAAQRLRHRSHPIPCGGGGHPRPARPASHPRGPWRARPRARPCPQPRHPAHLGLPPPWPPACPPSPTWPPSG